MLIFHLKCSPPASTDSLTVHLHFHSSFSSSPQPEPEQSVGVGGVGVLQPIGPKQAGQSRVGRVLHNISFSWRLWRWPF